jgi:hypothetical protein
MRIGTLTGPKYTCLLKLSSYSYSCVFGKIFLKVEGFRCASAEESIKYIVHKPSFSCEMKSIEKES